MISTQTSKVNIGTLTQGTLRSEDLIPAFTYELAYLSNGQHPLLHEIKQFDWYSEDISLDIGDSQQEIASDLVNDLMDALNEYAPAHTYFGTLDGDGSDFGFWPDGEPFELCDTKKTREGWIDNDCKVIVEINDHGNVTVMDMNRNELWSAV